MKVFRMKRGMLLLICILALTICAGSALTVSADQGEAAVNTLTVKFKDGSDAAAATDTVLYPDQTLKLYLDGKDYSDKVVTIIAGEWEYPNWSNLLKKGNEYKLSKGVLTLDGKKIFKKIGENKLTLQVNLPGGQRRWVNIYVEKAPVEPSPVTFTKMTAGKKMITAKWKRGKNATGYEVQCSAKKNFKVLRWKKEIYKGGITSFKFTGLKRKTKYYFRIRSIYYEDGEYTYSKWSKVKAVKTK